MATRRYKLNDGRKIAPETDVQETQAPGVGKKGPHPTNEASLRRLKIIEGQIRGIQKMVEEEKYCVDILNQISAVRSALNNVGKVVLRRHIDHCVANAIRDGGKDSRDIIDELMDVLAKEQI